MSVRRLANLLILYLTVAFGTRRVVLSFRIQLFKITARRISLTRRTRTWPDTGRNTLEGNTLQAAHLNESRLVARLTSIRILTSSALFSNFGNLLRKPGMGKRKMKHYTPMIVMLVRCPRFPTFGHRTGGTFERCVRVEESVWRSAESMGSKLVLA